MREHADLVLEEEDGAGIAELLNGPYVKWGTTLVSAALVARHRHLRRRNAGKVPGSQARILVTGPAGSGKSYVVGLLAEQWIQAGYCVLLLDPEGDHVELQEFNQVQLFDARNHLPEPDELVSRLHPQTSVVVDLSVLAGPHKADYLHRMRSAAVVHREAYGFPHWVIYDEAHLLGSHEEPHWTRRGGYVLSSLRPASLAANEIDETDVVLTLENPDTKGPGESRPLRRAGVRFGAETPRSFTLAERRTAHVRHRHKYAEVSLPRERRFSFGQSAASYCPPRVHRANSAPRSAISIRERSGTTSHGGTSPDGWMTPLPTRSWPRKWLRGRTSCWRIEPRTSNEYVASSSRRSIRGIWHYPTTTD